MPACPFTLLNVLNGYLRYGCFSWTCSSEDEAAMVVSGKDVQVYHEVCLSSVCEDTCKLQVIQPTSSPVLNSFQNPSIVKSFLIPIPKTQRLQGFGDPTVIYLPGVVDCVTDDRWQWRMDWMELAVDWFCILQKCQLCSHCLRQSGIDSLKDAYREHVNRGAWRRVFPRPFHVRGKPSSWRGE